jgi:hypothetical protein
MVPGGWQALSVAWLGVPSAKTQGGMRDDRAGTRDDHIGGGHVMRYAVEEAETGRPTRAVPPMELIWLGALVVGIVLPYAQAIPWLVAHGLDVRRFVDELFATPISSFFAWDVIIAIGILLILAATTPMPARHRGLVVVGSLLGASVGLPLLLYLRERQRRYG